MLSIYQSKNLEKNLIERGITFQRYPDDFYFISLNNEAHRKIRIKLISSDQVNESKQGSKNGTVIQAIGYFRFPLPNGDNEPDFFIFGMEDRAIQGIDYVVLPQEEFSKRIIGKILNPTENRIVEIVFWLMPDRCVYDCTGIGMEGDWYFISKGVNGRMADGTDWDYSEYFNDWERLK